MFPFNSNISDLILCKDLASNPAAANCPALKPAFFNAVALKPAAFNWDALKPASFRDSSSLDGASAATPSGSTDEISKAAVSVDYAVASGVTTTLGYLSQTAKDEGTKKDTSSGSSWYIGTNLSF